MTDTHCNQLLVDNEFRGGICVSLDDVIIHATFCQQQLITTITRFHPCVTTLYLDCAVPPDWGHCSIVCNIPPDGLIILLSASRHSGSYILDIHVVVLRRQLYSCNCSIAPCHLQGNYSTWHSNVVKLLGQKSMINFADSLASKVVHSNNIPFHHFPSKVCYVQSNLSYKDTHENHEYNATRRGVSRWNLLEDI